MTGSASLSALGLSVPMRRALPGWARLLARRMAGYAAVLAGFLVAWQAALVLFRIPPYLLPSPGAAGAALLAHAGTIGGDALYTVGCTIAGMALSVAVACLMAVAFLASQRLADALMPLVVVVRTVPVIAVAPLLVVLLGRGAWNSIGIVALLSFFPILLAARRGLAAPGPSMLELMHVLGAGFLRTLVTVRLPAAVPFLFTGLRIASGSAILCAMFAEWLSGAPGLGNLTLDSYSRQDFPLMWAAVLATTTVSYAFLALTAAAEAAILARRG